MENKVKQVIVARKDLKMRKGKLAAQVGHAVMYATERWLTSTCTADQHAIFRSWQQNGTPKIVVGAEDEQALLNLEQEAYQKGIPTFRVIDKGLTEFDGESTLTCVAFGPVESDKIDPLTKLLPLL